jgi:hypothetical protein
MRSSQILSILNPEVTSLCERVIIITIIFMWFYIMYNTVLLAV